MISPTTVVLADAAPGNGKLKFRQPVLVRRRSKYTPALRAPPFGEKLHHFPDGHVCLMSYDAGKEVLVMDLDG
eukprot:12887518-Prorocentrum_lima.AAC.1